MFEDSEYKRGKKSSWSSWSVYLSLPFAGEELADLLLLVDVVLLQQLLVEPVWVANSGNRVLHLKGKNQDCE